MITKSKLIHGIKDEQFERFSLYCRKNKIKIGDVINDLIEEYLKDKGVK